jgi:predicted metal-dependent hydrolase
VPDSFRSQGTRILGRMADVDRIAAGLAQVRSGRGFEAHELFEELWRAAAPAERDLYQGLVHVAVATYQDGRGNAVGRSRQLEKALLRLAAYAPAYEGIDIEVLLAWCRASLAAGRCGPLPVAPESPSAPGRRQRRR